jgi:hypothetical protein
MSSCIRIFQSERARGRDLSVKQVLTQKTPIEIEPNAEIGLYSKSRPAVTDARLHTRIVAADLSTTSEFLLQTCAGGG